MRTVECSQATHRSAPARRAPPGHRSQPSNPSAREQSYASLAMSSAKQAQHCPRAQRPPGRRAPEKRAPRRNRHMRSLETVRHKTAKTIFTSNAMHTPRISDARNPNTPAHVNRATPTQQSSTMFEYKNETKKSWISSATPKGVQKDAQNRA